MNFFDKPYMHVSLTELQLFALFSWTNEWVFCYPSFYPFVLIITLFCSTEGKDTPILRPLPRKSSAMEKYFLREPPAFLRMGAKGARPLWILLAVLPTFPLYARSWLKNISFTSMSDWSQVCHTLRLAVAREQLRWPVAIFFFFWKNFMQPKAHQYHKLIPYMLREFLKFQGTISVDSDTEVFFDAKRPVHKSEGKKVESSYSCNNWS